MADSSVLDLPSILGIIPARGGSKGIYRKNLKILAGKTLLAWTAEAALASHLQRVVLSTDDEEIAAHGASVGLQVPFLRPANLARDDTRTIDVIQHTIRKTQWEGWGVCVLQPTNPLRTARQIDDCLQMLAQHPRANSLMSVAVCRHHPWQTYATDGEYLVPTYPPGEFVPRQHMPMYWYRDGSIYMATTDLARSGTLRGSKCLYYPIPNDRVCQIDTPEDLPLAELLLTKPSINADNSMQSATRTKRRRRHKSR